MCSGIKNMDEFYNYGKEMGDSTKTLKQYEKTNPTPITPNSIQT